MKKYISSLFISLILITPIYSIQARPMPKPGFIVPNLSLSIQNYTHTSGTANSPVYALDILARRSDMIVETINLEVGTTLNGLRENPAVLINTVVVKNGSTVLATIPVNTYTFTRDTSNRYYIQLARLGFKIPKNKEKTLTIAFNTNAVDFTRTVTVNTYGPTSIRSTDALGINTYNGVEGNMVHTFTK